MAIWRENRVFLTPKIDFIAKRWCRAVKNVHIFLCNNTSTYVGVLILAGIRWDQVFRTIFHRFCGYLTWKSHILTQKIDFIQKLRCPATWNVTFLLFNSTSTYVGVLILAGIRWAQVFRTQFNRFRGYLMWKSPILTILEPFWWISRPVFDRISSSKSSSSVPDTQIRPEKIFCANRSDSFDFTDENVKKIKKIDVNRNFAENPPPHIYAEPDIFVKFSHFRSPSRRNLAF